MNSNFEALFTHLNPTDDQIKAMLQDLWRKNDEKQNELDKLRRENSQKAHKIMTMDRKNDDLTNEIEVLKMLAAGANVSCPVCLENFDTEDHQAYVLSCPHMICSRCLHPAFETNVDPLIYRMTRTGRVSRPATSCERLNNRHVIHDENHPSKRCPVCREPVYSKLKKICLNA